MIDLVRLYRYNEVKMQNASKMLKEVKYCKEKKEKKSKERE